MPFARDLRELAANSWDQTARFFQNKQNVLKQNHVLQGNSPVNAQGIPLSTINEFYDGQFEGYVRNIKNNPNLQNLNQWEAYKLARASAEYTTNETFPEYSLELGDKATATAWKFASNHPVGTIAGTAGGLGLNAVVGNPVGGVIDFATLGLTNWRADENRLSNQESYISPNRIPRLSQEDLTREIQRLQRNAATNVVTLGQLEQMKQGEMY